MGVWRQGVLMYVKPLARLPLCWGMGTDINYVVYPPNSAGVEMVIHSSGPLLLTWCAEVWHLASPCIKQTSSTERR